MSGFWCNNKERFRKSDTVTYETNTLPAKQPLFCVLIKITVNHKSCLRQALTTLCCFTCPLSLSVSPSEINIALVAICFRSQKPQIPGFPQVRRSSTSLESRFPRTTTIERASEIGRFGFLSSDKGWRVRVRRTVPSSRHFLLVLLSLFFSDHLNTFSHPDAAPLPLHESRFTLLEAKSVAPDFYSDLSIVTFLKGKAHCEIHHCFHN